MRLFIKNCPELVDHNKALSVLKTKWKYRNEISKEEYLSACEELLVTIREQNILIDAISLSNTEIFLKAERLINSYDIDFSDSLQLISLQFGEIASLPITIDILLITADKELALAATTENLLSWYVIDEPIPESKSSVS